MILKRFYSKSIIRFKHTNNLFSILIENEETISVEDRNKELMVGEYDVLNGFIYSVFSFQKSNYLFLMNKVIKITNSIEIKYRVNYVKDEVSYFEIFNNGKSLIREEYYNYRDPLINPLDGDEDWEYVNFAYHLAGYINKTKETPGIVLFPIATESPHSS